MPGESETEQLELDAVDDDERAVPDGDPTAEGARDDDVLTEGAPSELVGPVTPGGASYARLGHQVASVLRTAHEASARLRDRSRQAAEALVEAARREREQAQSLDRKSTRLNSSH